LKVLTTMRLPVPEEEAWKRLLFYEEIARRPPLLLRLLLPAPIRAQGDKTKVGEETRCLYDGGHLVKRTTLLARPWNYEFEVVEQALDVGGGVMLEGGGYTLRRSVRGGTDVVLETRYTSPHRPRWLWGPIESAICHAFHRHILGAMRRELSAPASARRTCPGHEARTHASPERPGRSPA